MTTPEGACRVRLHAGPFRGSGGRWLVQGVFFAGAWVYLWLVIQPRLIYDAFGIYLPYPEFTLEERCFHEAWSRAAGPVECVAAFLSQWFSAPVLGALIVTGTAALLCLGTNCLIRDMGARNAWLPGMVPALGVLALYRTLHHPLDALAALAACLWVAVAYQRMPILARGGGLARAGRPVVFLAACAGLYCLAGTVCVLFGLLVGTWCASVRRRGVAGVAAVAASVVTPWIIGTKWYYLTAMDAYSVAWPFGPGSTSDMELVPLMILRGLFLFPLGMLWVVATSRLLPLDLRGRIAAFPWWGRPTLRLPAQLALLTAGVVAVHLFLRAPHREVRFQMVHFSLQRQWDKVLHAARRLPGSGHDCFSRHLVNRALCHTGRLGDDMFTFSQDPAGLLLLSAEVPHGPPKFWMLSEIAWELGDLNLAEQWAFERLEAVGECPGALELLALVCLAKDQAPGQSTPCKDSISPGREAARMFLRRLRKHVTQCRRAEALWEAVARSSLAAEDWQIDRVRALRRRDDRVFQTYSEDLMLESLLSANPQNKMAFEYLMAFYLLSRRLDKFVQNLHRLNDFGCREIPRHYEEAILIHANATSRPVELRGQSIRRETAERFQQFVERFRSWPKQPHVAAAALAEEFGNSYFYYYAFGVSGVGRTQ